MTSTAARERDGSFEILADGSLSMLPGGVSDVIVTNLTCFLVSSIMVVTRSKS